MTTTLHLLRTRLAGMADDIVDARVWTTHARLAPLNRGVHTTVNHVARADCDSVEFDISTKHMHTDVIHVFEVYAVTLRVG